MVESDENGEFDPLDLVDCRTCLVKNDANNRSVFKMNDKIGMLADWLRSLGS